MLGKVVSLIYMLFSGSCLSCHRKMNQEECVNLEHGLHGARFSNFFENPKIEVSKKWEKYSRV
jgi:hypothetical protein